MVRVADGPLTLENLKARLTRLPPAVEEEAGPSAPEAGAGPGPGGAVGAGAGGAPAAPGKWLLLSADEVAAVARRRGGALGKAVLPLLAAGRTLVTWRLLPLFLVREAPLPWAPQLLLLLGALPKVLDADRLFQDGVPARYNEAAVALLLASLQETGRALAAYRALVRAKRAAFGLLGRSLRRLVRRRVKDRVETLLPTAPELKEIFQVEERLAAAKRDIQEGVQGLVEDTEQLLEAVGDKVAAKMEEAAADVEEIRADLRGRLGGGGPGRSWSVSSFSFPALLGDSRKPSLACSVPGLELALVPGPAPVKSHPINV